MSILVKGFMEINSLKFLLQLLGCPDYRSLLSDRAFNFRSKAKICRDLSSRGLIDFSREIAWVRILPPGRALLKTDTENLPITDKEVKVLEKISFESGRISSLEIAVPSVKTDEREEILKKLDERGLIEAEVTMKKTGVEVWLTSQGQEYLRHEFTAKGTQPSISLDFLTNYVSFLRKSLRALPAQAQGDRVALAPTEPSPLDSKSSDSEILQIIRDLDGEHRTDNYLPIFYLRQKLEPPLSREDLDRSLYSLQRQDKIELSSLAEMSAYTPEQINAGIPQDSGGPLFYIIIN